MGLSAIFQRLQNVRRRWTGEPTLAELLSDALVRSLMRADGIDPRTLETQLRGVAGQMAPCVSTVRPPRRAQPE